MNAVEASTVGIVEDDVWDKAWCDAWYTINTEYKDIANHMLSQYSDPVQIGRKSWKIYECLFLLCVDQDYYRKLQRIADGVDLTGDIVLNLPINNPWFKQYQTLFK